MAGLRQSDMAHDRERASVTRLRELHGRLKAAEEERRLMDIVVQEYADLVRELDAARRASPASSSASSLTLASSASAGSHDGAGAPSDAKLAASLAEGRLGLRRLLADFDAEKTRLEDEITRLHGELATVLAGSEAATRAHEECMEELAEAKAQLDKLQSDDRSAAQMVSRYM